MIYFFPPHFISFIRPDTDTLFPPTHQRAMIQYFLSHKNSCSIGKPLHRDGKVDFHGNFSGSLVSRHFFFFKYSFSSNAIFTLFSLSTLQLRSFFRLAFSCCCCGILFFSANSHKLNTQILPLRTKSKSFSAEASWVENRVRRQKKLRRKCCFVCSGCWGRVLAELRASVFQCKFASAKLVS